MGTIGKLSAYFPGARADKVKISILFKKGVLEVEYADGSTHIFDDPIQVQEISIPAGKGPLFVKRLREYEPTASKNCYFERSFLEAVRKEILK